MPIVELPELPESWKPHVKRPLDDQTALALDYERMQDDIRDFVDKHGWPEFMHCVGEAMR